MPKSEPPSPLAVRKQYLTFSNGLVRAAHSLTLIEMRLIYLAAGQLPRAYSDWGSMSLRDYINSPPIIVTGAAIQETFGGTLSQAYKDLKAAAEHLYDRSIVWHASDHSDQWTRWVTSRVRYQNGAVGLKFNADILDELIDMRPFTKIEFKYVGQFKSSYTIKLYSILKSWESIPGGKIDIQLADLHFQLDTSVSNRSNFNKLSVNVLVGAIAEINEKTDLTVSYKAKKAGRKVTAICFTIKSKVAQKIKAEKLSGLTVDEVTMLEAYKWGYGKITTEQAAKKLNDTTDKSYTADDVAKAWVRYESMPKNKPTHDETLAMREKERQAREARYANATDVEDIAF